MSRVIPFALTIMVLALLAPAAADGNNDRFDLVFTERDANGFPLNPLWKSQADGLGLPDPVKHCGGFPWGVAQGVPRCTTQNTSTDTPGWFHSYFCAFGGKPGHFKGHVNWVPVTYEGFLSFNDKQPEVVGDDDYTFSFWPPDKKGLTAHNPDILHPEANGDETFDSFRVGWWDRFRLADAGDREKLLDRRTAVVTGLMGLDMVHGGGSELHPIYAMAILTDRQSAADGVLEDTWAIFARNWGNEGWCGSKQHYVKGLPNGELSIGLTLSGAEDVEVVWSKTRFQQKVGGSILGPNVAWTPEDGKVYVSFRIPEPEKKPRVHGELTLRWRRPSGAGSLVAPQVPDRPEPDEGPPTDQTEAFVRALSEGIPQDRAAALTETEAVDEQGDTAPVDRVGPQGLLRLDASPEGPPTPPRLESVVEENPEGPRQLQLLCQAAASLLESSDLRRRAESEHGVSDMETKLKLLVERCEDDGPLE